MSGLGEKIGRAMSEANKAHILTYQREMSFRELGEVAARAIPALEGLGPDTIREEWSRLPSRSEQEVGRG